MKITLKQVKAGAQLPAAIYKSKPYVVLSKEGVVFAAGDIHCLTRLGNYYDEFQVAIRCHNMHRNDNAKLPTSQFTPVDLRELLRACKQAADWFSRSTRQDDRDEVEDLRAAIAKAQGCGVGE